MEAFIRHIGGDGVRAERLVQRVPASDARTLMWARVTVHRQATAVRRSLAAIESDVPRVAIEKQVLLATVAIKRSNTLAEGHLTRAADLATTSGFALALLGCPHDILGLADRWPCAPAMTACPDWSAWRSIPRVRRTPRRRRLLQARRALAPR